MTEPVVPSVIVPLAGKLGGPEAEEHAKAYYDDMRKGDYSAAVSEAVKSNLEIASRAAHAAGHGLQALGSASAHVFEHDKPASTPAAENTTQQGPKK